VSGFYFSVLSIPQQSLRRIGLAPLRWYCCISRSDVGLSCVSRADHLRRQFACRQSCADQRDRRSEVSGSSKKRSTHLLSSQLHNQRPPEAASCRCNRRIPRRRKFTLCCRSVFGLRQFVVLRPTYTCQTERHWRSGRPGHPHWGTPALVAVTEDLPDW